MKYLIVKHHKCSICTILITELKQNQKLLQAEQVLINQKEDEIENLEEIISDGGTTLKEVDNKKKLLDDAIENATKENAAWQAADAEISKNS